MQHLARALAHWFSNGLDHVFSTPLEDRQHPPPLVGVQPFSGDPAKRVRRH